MCRVSPFQSAQSSSSISKFWAVSFLVHFWIPQCHEWSRIFLSVKIKVLQRWNVRCAKALFPVSPFLKILIRHFITYMDKLSLSKGNVFIHTDIMFIWCVNVLLLIMRIRVWVYTNPIWYEQWNIMTFNKSTYLSKVEIFPQWHYISLCFPNQRVFHFASVQLLSDRNSFPLMYCLYIRKCQTCRNVKDCRATWERLRVGKKYQLMSLGLPLTELQPL